jgi:phosphatidylglycerol---prolipoprotein diacylglyceryl transferase
MLAASTESLGVPFFHLGSLDIGIPIQYFGIIVAIGVLIGAAILRRYGEWHGQDDDHIRVISTWVAAFGFAGAHIFNVLFYEFDRWMREPILILKVWDGISSYGGFVGGVMGFALYIWWKRLPFRLWADTVMVGFLPAFTIGRIGCTVVSDHVGAFVDRANWYAALAMEYPRAEPINAEVRAMVVAHPPAAPEDATVLLWNLGLVEFLYLVPINLLVLWLAFRPSKRPNAGFITALIGVCYAPVRFFLDYLRPEGSDPRHFGFTFAQWVSLIAFGLAVYFAARVLKNGAPAEPITRTSGEAQAKLKLIMKETDAEEKAAQDDDGAKQADKAKKAK